MTKYRVLVKEIHRYYVDVEAENLAAAEEVADEGLTFGAICNNSFVDIERVCTAVDRVETRQ